MRFFSIIFILILSFSSKAGGPWTMDKNKGYFKLSEWGVVFDQHFTSSGKLDPNLTTGIFNTFLYAEYGFTNRLTGILNSNVFSRNYMNNLVSGTTGQVIVPGEALNYIGDSDLGVKYSLTKKGSDYPLAVSAVLGIPLGKSSGGSTGNLQTGDGEFNQIIQLDFGHGLNISSSVTGYYSLYAGFNNRTNGFSEEIRYGIEGGLSFWSQKTWVIARIGGVESLKNGFTAATVNSTSIFANNTEFTSVSIEINQYLNNKIGISAGVAGAFRGEIIAAAPSFTFGVFLDLSK